MLKKYILKRLMLALIAISPVATIAQHTIPVYVGANGNTFTPSTVNCAVGDTIRFIWSGSGGTIHDVVSDDATTIPYMDGQTGEPDYKVGMTKTGTFGYSCTSHPGMTGTINVVPALPTTNYFSFSENPGALNLNGFYTHSGIFGQVQIINIPGDAGAGNNLSYTGLPNSMGNRISIVAGNAEDLNAAITPIHSGSAYFSALIKVPTTTGLAGNTFIGNYFMHLSDTLGGGITTGFVGRLHIRTGSQANTFNLGILNTSGGPAATITDVYGATPADYNIDQTYLVVVKYTYATNTASLWINPVIDVNEPLALMQNTTGTNAATKSRSICIREAGNGTSGTGTIEIDEIRVSNSWTGVLGLPGPDPTVKFDPTTQSLNEDEGTATLTVAIADPNENDTQVDVILLRDGTETAEEGTDFTYATTKTVIFPAYSTEPITIDVPIIDDNEEEGDETFKFVLRNATNHAIIDADSIHTVTILANDQPVPTLGFNPVTAVELKEGSGQYIFQIAIGNPNANATSVDVFVQAEGTTADGADYTIKQPMTITFPAGSTVAQSDTITIIDDNLSEQPENIVLVLRNPTNGAQFEKDSLLTITISASDRPLVPYFTPKAVTVNESAGQVTASINAAGANSNTNPTSFDVVLKGGSATEGSDFTFTTQTITIPPMTDSIVNLDIPILNDKLIEGDEMFTLVIRNITNGGFTNADSICTVTLKSDDVPFKKVSALRANNADGIPVLKDSIVNIIGVVYGVDLQGSATSLQYTLIDSTGGVGIFRSGANNPPVINIVPVEGDSVSVYGKVSEFNGLTQVTMDSIIVLSQGNPLKKPTIITRLGESTESDLVQFQNATIVDTVTQTGSGITMRIANDRGDTLDLRIDADVDLFQQPISGTFHVTGIGGQFDSSIPKDAGYQLLPRRISDVLMLPTVHFPFAELNVGEEANGQSIVLQLSSPAVVSTSVTIVQSGGDADNNDYYLVPADGVVTFEPGEDTASFVLVINDDADDENVETIVLGFSNLINCLVPEKGQEGLELSINITDNDNGSVGINQALTPKSVRMYPNPTNDQLFIHSDELVKQIVIFNSLGQTITTINSLKFNELMISMHNYTKGIYSIKVITDKGNITKRVVVE